MKFHNDIGFSALKWLPGVFLAAALTACGGSDNDPDPSVTATEQGVVEGEEENSMVAFRGMPYAAPPIGELRFQPPQPVTNYGRMDATEFGGSCVQPGGSAFSAGDSTEDCLYLNVYRPKEAGTYPVMVWIHGGAFETGSADTYLPPALVQQGLVVVSINYRLGILGFLAHESLSAESSSGASGDYGLMDQQAALQWVQDNIAAFGGNPNNVTIFGESAGGHSVLSHLVSPASAGLFHKVIVQSGAFGPNQPTLSQAETTGNATVTGGQTIVAELGCADAADVPACLRGLSQQAFVDAQEANDYQFGPNLRPDVLPNSIASALDSGNFPRVPVMMGTNRDEYRLFVASNEFSDADDDGVPDGDVSDDEPTFRALINGLTGIPTGSPTMDSLVTSAYDWDTQEFNSDVSLAYSAVGTDALFVCPALDQARDLSNHVATYAYEFADRDAPNLLPAAPSFDMGAAHAFEIQYVFYNETMRRERGMNDSQIALADSMVTYWSQFAKYGDPNASGSETLWPTYDSEAAYLTLDTDVIATQPEADFSAAHRCDSVWLSD